MIKDVQLLAWWRFLVMFIKCQRFVTVRMFYSIEKFSGQKSSFALQFLQVFVLLKGHHLGFKGVK